MKQSTSKNISLSGASRMALKRIEPHVINFMDPQIFDVEIVSLTPAMLAQVIERSRIEEAGQLRCSGAEIGSFVMMLRSPLTLQTCASFLFLQFANCNAWWSSCNASLKPCAEWRRSQSPSFCSFFCKYASTIINTLHPPTKLLPFSITTSKVSLTFVILPFSTCPPPPIKFPHYSRSVKVKE